MAGRESIWMKLQQLPNALSQLQTLYDANFLEVRHFCSAWIEAQPWDQIDDVNLFHDDRATHLCQQLVQNIELEASNLTDFSMFAAQLRLQQSAQLLRDRNPMDIVRMIKNCLNMEKIILESASQPNAQAVVNSSQTEFQMRMRDEMLKVQQNTDKAEQLLRTAKEEQQFFVLIYQEYIQTDRQIENLKKSISAGQRRQEDLKLYEEKKLQFQQDMTVKARTILHHRLDICRIHRDTLEILNLLKTVILDEELPKWKRQQQLAGNGAPFDCSLESLQYWCENLMDLIWANRKQMKTGEAQRREMPMTPRNGENDPWEEQLRDMDQLVAQLVSGTFIIDNQPPQVLRKDSKFTASVRLLVGSRLHVNLNPPTVKASLVSEEQVRQRMSNNGSSQNEQIAAEIVNSSSQMEYNQSNRELSATFKNMQLRKIKRAERRQNERVAEEKFSILFQSHFPVGGGELVFNVWTLSLPVVVTVHGNQECNALATILWDNAFAMPGRVLFQVPDHVTWPRLAETLNTKFKASTGRGLTEENLNYLACKLFDQSTSDFSQCLVSRSLFQRDLLPGKSFTFWDWFHAVMKLTKEWMCEPWKEGLVHGFISHEQASEKLLPMPRGTFLLRFSDSKCGGVSIALVGSRGCPEERFVGNVDPFTEQDFKIRSLADRISDLTVVSTLYPDQDKSVFYKFKPEKRKDSPDPSNPTGHSYFPSVLIMHLPDLPGHPSDQSSVMSPASSAWNQQTASPSCSHHTNRTSPTPSLTDFTIDDTILDMETFDSSITDEIVNMITSTNSGNLEHISTNQLFAPFSTDQTASRDELSESIPTNQLF